MNLSITVVGAGVVGANLARKFVDLGHHVRFAARNPASDKVTAARESLGLAAVPLGRAADGAEFVVLAVPFAAVADTVEAMGDLGDAILVDATNTVGSSLPADATTIVDVIASINPSARVVKAFNTIGAEAYLDPKIDGTPIFLPIAGDEDAADRVRGLAAEMGFDALVIGDRSAVHMLENFAELWIHLAFRVGLGRSFGFARLTRPD